MTEKKIIIDDFELIEKYLSKVLVVGTNSNIILSVGDMQSNYNNKIFIGLDETNFSHFYKYLYNFIKKDLKENGKNFTLEFLNCEFTLPFLLNNGLRSSYFQNLSFKFSSCVFQNFIFSDAVLGGKIEFNLSEFKSDIYFRNSIFKETVKFYTCTFFNKLYLENITFEKLADFFDSTFTKSVNFYKTDFKGNVVFSASTFKENVLFIYSTIDQSLILRDTKIEKGLDLSLAIINGKISTHGINIVDEKFEADDSPNLSAEDYEKKLQDNIIPIRNKRETYRIIKFSFEQISSYIDALRFESLEKITYQKELKSRNIKWYNSDMLIFIFNNYSTRHKQSWGRGALITLRFSFFFYLLAIITSFKFHICLEAECVNNFWPTLSNHFIGIIYFLNPVHDPNYLFDLFGLNKSGTFFLFYFFDYLGRIFVGYGIYQTVQAFRKFK
jgi:uncharacterized protein YjbI with pentapeptide repeats